MTEQAQAQAQAQQGNQLARLKALKGQKKSAMTRFDGLVVVEVGVEPSLYYPKLKTAEGATVKGEDGKDKRAETPSGWTYTFTEYATAKTVKVVLHQQLNLQPLAVLTVSGEGYDIRAGNMIFIQANGKISQF